jgi:pantoate--beta-alanine ligase
MMTTGQRMQIVNKIVSMRRLASRWRENDIPVALVPTMGYLHRGHMSLVRRARRAVGVAGRVVLSIYVNPTQFGPNEDLAHYPRDLPRDKKLCAQAGVDALFVPSDTEMYPAGFSTYVVEGKLSAVMEGASRPGHFRGVTTVVAKLFHIVSPTAAIFGAKDFQQSAIIRRMAGDLNLPVKIIVAPTCREADGLALSSRNAYLTAQERAQAPILWQALQYASKAARTGRIPSARLKEDVRRLIATQSQARLDYVELFDRQTLEPVPVAGAGTQMALAVFLGKTRLIDNARLG